MPDDVLNRSYDCGNCGGLLAAGTRLADLSWDAKRARPGGTGTGMWCHITCPPKTTIVPTAPAASAQSATTVPDTGRAELAPLDRMEPTELAAKYGVDREQLHIIRENIARDLTDGELRYYLNVAKMRGLSPWARQIHAMKYTNRRTGRTDLVIQTGIDGYRLIASRTEQLDGIDEPEYGPTDMEQSGSMALEHPVWVKVRVWRKGASHPFVGVARWSEYRRARRNDKGEIEVDRIWADRPYGQLAKCAESLALRMAFPEQLSGLYTHEEMDQAGNEDASLAPRPVVDTRAKVTESQ